MKFKDAITQLSHPDAISIAKRYCENQGKSWESPICLIFKCVLENPELSPQNIGSSKDDATVAIEKWVAKYFAGYANRASQRLSAMPGTIPDPIIDTIISSRLTHLSAKQLTDITYAHRLSMSAENILGLLLEEYLAEKLLGFGWYCAWGETVRAVDFISENGQLLQIKNRSNSENSSSSRVRNDTTISKWFRVKHNTGEYMWDSLNQLCAATIFSEKDFRAFVVHILETNPTCLAIEANNPWQT